MFLAWCIKHNHQTYLCTKMANKHFFGYFVGCVLTVQCPNAYVSGAAHQVHLLLHHKCKQTCLCMRSMRVFKMHNVKKCAFLLWDADCLYLCTKIATKFVFGYLLWVCFKCTMLKNYIFGVAHQPHTPLHQKYQQECLWIRSTGVFGMHNTKHLVSGAEGAYFSTKSATKSVFGYLVWVCLRCTMPQKVCVWCVAPNAHTASPHLPTTVSLEA